MTEKGRKLDLEKESRICEVCHEGIETEIHFICHEGIETGIHFIFQCPELHTGKRTLFQEN